MLLEYTGGHTPVSHVELIALAKGNVWQLLSFLNANYFTPRMLITPSNSRLSRLRFWFFAWTYRHVTNWF